MTKDKISSQEIIDLVAAKASVSKRAAEEFLKVMIATIEEALIAGDVVKVKGFGTFKLQWIEPRKSVNVQTGDEIVLDGYHKVTFAPETTLKELVNEPFSHLESVQLDSGNELIVPEVIDEPPLDPLRVFTEQASEIKDLLFEIQALSGVQNTEPVDSVEDVVSSVPDAISDEVLDMKYELVDFQEVEEQVNQTEFIDSLNEPEVEQTPELESPFAYNLKSESQPLVDIQLVVDDTDPIVENVNTSESAQTKVADDDNNSDLDSSPFLMGLPTPRKKLRWLWISSVLLLMGAGVVSFLFIRPVQEFGMNAMAKTKAEIAYLKENMSVTDMANSISRLFVSEPKINSITETVVIPKDTSALDTIELDTIKAKVDVKEVKDLKTVKPAVAVDSLQLLFDRQRVYDNYIGSEQISSGSRLTNISLKYYGSKDFWVYIYEANIDRIENPDNIQIGTLIRIPKLNPKLIDASNKRCVQKAKELRNLYVK